MLQYLCLRCQTWNECREPFGGGVGQQNLWVFPAGSVRERNWRTVQPTDFQDTFLKPGGTQIVQDLLAGRKNSDPRNLLAKWNGKSACFRKRFEKKTSVAKISATKFTAPKLTAPCFRPSGPPAPNTPVRSCAVHPTEPGDEIATTCETGTSVDSHNLPPPFPTPFILAETAASVCRCSLR